MGGTLGLNRHAKRQDANAKELVTLARKLGMKVYYINTPVDLLVRYKNQWFPTEIKYKDGTFTAQQLEFAADCALSQATMWTWYTTDDVLNCAK
jgi:hypothetical protein